jgi:H+/Cl- antiporter ClcA
MAVFKDRVIERALVAGIIIGAVCYFIPNLMFSGETEIHGIIANPAAIGLPMLLLMALLKPLLLALSLKSGYLGGPIFPALFTATMVGLAISLLAPGVPLAVLVMCPAVGVITLLLRAPLTAILLVSVMVSAGASATMIGLITVAAATSLGVGMVLQRAQARRAAQPQGAQVQPG